MDMRKWFKEAQYGMMVHWGLYSLLAGEYKDRYSGVYAEWIQAHLAIPNAEYGKLTKAFNPVFFNAEEWVKLAKDCGMKYFVVTSKHHDGFAMFHSKVDKYNVVDATPFGRDVVAEIGEACYKHGLKMGLYYSQDLDWHEPNGGGYLSNHIPSQGVTWENSWDFPDTAHKNFDLCFENKIYPQVEELLRNYGDLCLIWFDMPMTLKENQSRALFEAIKKYQPDCLINSHRRLQALSQRPLRDRCHDERFLGLLCPRPALERCRCDRCQQEETEQYGNQLPLKRRSRRPGPHPAGQPEDPS